MKQKHYRITLNEGANTLCEKIAALAARFNGGNESYNLENLYHVSMGNLIEYGGLNKGLKADLTGRFLNIDLDKGTEVVNVLNIEEIEIFQLDEIPTLDREQEN